MSVSDEVRFFHTFRSIRVECIPSFSMNNVNNNNIVLKHLFDSRSNEFKHGTSFKRNRIQCTYDGGEGAHGQKMNDSNEKTTLSL